MRAGVIGLGDMGSGLAKNLIKNGILTTGFDLSNLRICRLLGKLPLESAQAAQSISALVVQNKGALISQEKIKQFSLIK